MIYDCFLFDGELDMLAARLTELQDRVDWFVLVEAAETFQGTAKALTFKENAARFARWPILPVVAELSGSDAWEREASQRAAMALMVNTYAQPDDLIVVSDVDEIWRADTDLTLDDGPLLVLELAHYVYSFGYRHPDPWSGPVVTTKRALDEMPFEAFQTLRGCRLHPRPPRRRNAGWHLSWFGGVQTCRDKLAAFSHTELADVDIEALMVAQLHVDGTPLIPITTRDVPRWVADGQSPEVWG